MDNTTAYDEKWGQFSEITPSRGQDEGWVNVEFYPRPDIDRPGFTPAIRGVSCNAVVTLRERSNGELVVAWFDSPDFQPAHLTREDYEEKAIEVVCLDRTKVADSIG